jgi:hypothetical protein
MDAKKAQQADAARALLSIPAGERLAYLSAIENQDLHDAERAKSHPLQAAKFSQQELADLKAHLLDAGGVTDDAGLLQVFMRALLDDDFATVCQEIPHIVKAWMKARGAISSPAPGAVLLNGFAPTPPPLVESGKE